MVRAEEAGAGTHDFVSHASRNGGIALRNKNDSVQSTAREIIGLHYPLLFWYSLLT
jgi:hypothetical protein